MGMGFVGSESVVSGRALGIALLGAQLRANGYETDILDLSLIHIFTPDIVAACRANHILINAWTVDTPEAIRRAIDLQVDGIITNVPDKVLAALGR